MSWLERSPECRRERTPGGKRGKESPQWPSGLIKQQHHLPWGLRSERDVRMFWIHATIKESSTKYHTDLRNFQQRELVSFISTRIKASLKVWPGWCYPGDQSSHMAREGVLPRNGPEFICSVHDQQHRREKSSPDSRGEQAPDQGGGSAPVPVSGCFGTLSCNSP